MEETKGHCKHGEFDLREGCPQCIAEKRGNPVIATDKRGRPVVADTSPGQETSIRPEQGVIKATYLCPDNCQYLLQSGGSFDNPEIGGCTKEDLLPDGTNLEREGDYPQCPFYKPPETAVALRPGEDIEAHGYFEEATRFLKYAERRVIATPEDVKAANDDLSLISKLKKVMENKRKSLLNPLKLQADAIRETYDYLMAPIRQADGLTREKMLAYNAEQQRIRLEQEDINRKRLEAAEQEMNLKGELSESVNLVEVAPEAPKSVLTAMGASGQRDNWKHEVVDFALLPDAYKVADSSQLNTIAKSHHDKKQVPGVRFYNEPIIAVRAR